MKSIAIKLRKNISAKNAFILFFKIVISLSVLLFLTHSISYDKIILPLKNANYYLVTISFLLVFANLYFQFKRWKILCNRTLNEYNNKTILRSLFYGFSGGIFTPLRIGEYIGRAICLNNSVSRVSLATILDKFFLLFLIAISGSISSLLFLHYFYSTALYITLPLFFLIFALCCLVYFSIFNSDFWERLLFTRLSHIKYLNKFITQFDSFHKLDLRSVSYIFIYSVLFYATFILQFGLLVAAFSNQWDIPNYCWIGILVVFAKTLIPPVTFGELGIREGASVFFIVFLHLPEAVGFNASIFIFLINILFPAAIGLFLFMKKA